MKPETAETVANVVLAATAVAVAYAVIRTPALRRFAWGLAVAAITTHVPAWLNREVRTAWVASGEHAHVPRGSVGRP